MSATPATLNESDRDSLMKWLADGRELLQKVWPGTAYAVVVAEQREGMPAATLPITLSSSTSPSVSPLPQPPPPS